MARKISGKLLALDIQRGASYEELLERYDVTPQAMDRFFEGLVKAGRVDAAALPIAEDMRGKTLRTCPKCAVPLKTDSEECPSCGILVSKFLKRMQAEDEKRRASEQRAQVKPQPKPNTNDKAKKSSAGSLIIGGFLGLLVILVVFIVSNPVKKHDTPIGANRGQQALRSLPSAPAVPIAADKLSSWYQDNEVKSDAEFKGKILEVTGIVRNVGKDISGDPYVSLKGSDRAFLGVKCLFFREREPDLASLRPGQQVIIKGVCIGKFGVVVLDGCEFIRK